VVVLILVKNDKLKKELKKGVTAKAKKAQM
jgi:hypothetical protein